MTAGPTIAAQIAAAEDRLHEIADARQQLGKTMGALDSEAARLTRTLAALNAARAELRHGVTISDHALVRWLERHYGMDLEPYRREMASAVLADAIAAGASGVRTAQGTFKIRDGVVTTFVKAEAAGR